MRKYLLNITAFLLATVMALSFQSCSVIGFGIGRKVDRNLGPQKYLHPTWVSEFEPQMKIKVVNQNGFVYKGVFHGLDTIPMTYDTLISVMMEARGQPIKIYLHNIEYINVPENAKKWKWIGLGIGIVVDTALIASGWEGPPWLSDMWSQLVDGLFE